MSDSRRRQAAKSRRKQQQVDEESSNDAPEEVTAIDAKAIERKEQIARELAASRASQRAADAKQRRRDVAQRRQLESVKRKKSIVPAQNDVVVDDDVVEDQHGSEVPPPVTRGKNHQFLSDEIIAELARQEDERDGAVDVEDERARTDAKRRKVKRQSRQVSTNLEVRVLSSGAVVHNGVAPEILAFKQKHFYGDRVKRVDERTLSRRRGPMPLFSIEKK